MNQRERALRRINKQSDSCPKTEAFIKGIFNRLVEGSQLEDFVKADPEVKLSIQCRNGVRSLPVARAAAGRVIIVPASLPYHAMSADAVAAVLSHELAHLTLRHTERLIAASFESEQGIGAQLRPKRKRRGPWLEEMKKAHEREADITGLRILSNAGYDPLAAVDHLKQLDALAKKRFPSRKKRAEHDEPIERVQLMMGQIESCGYRSASRLGPADSIVKHEIEGKNKFIRRL